MSKTTITEIIESEIDTVLADDIDFTGELKFSKSLMIKGKFDGKINAEGHLFIGPNAHVKAEIKTGKLTCYGRIDGPVFAKERVELSKESILNGDVTTPDIIIESGCKFNGRCIMDEKQQHVSTTQQTTQQSNAQQNPPKKQQ
ncbi:MAG TPA: polymer-forming cytoskeletal protein [Exilispira sp.]|nr:polymer-forming cytoskeletal protein [Exilispira sp.]